METMPVEQMGRSTAAETGVEEEAGEVEEGAEASAAEVGPDDDEE